MNSFLTQLTDDPWGRLILQYLVTGGIRNCFLTLLVIARLTGVFVVAPWIMSVSIPLSARIGLVMLLSFVISPIVSTALDLEPVIFMNFSSEYSVDSLTDAGTELGLLLASEVGLGILLGAGVMIVFFGLKLGGEWLDRHSGLGMGKSFNPELSVGESTCGQVSLLLGIAAFLLMEPINGHSLVLKSLVESFRNLPPGTPFWSDNPLNTIAELVQQSVVLGVRIAIPLAVTMLLIDLTLAIASRNSPQPLSASLYLIRASLGVLVLACTMTAIPEVITASAVSLLD